MSIPVSRLNVIAIPGSCSLEYHINMRIGIPERVLSAVVSSNTPRRCYRGCHAYAQVCIILKKRKIMSSSNFYRLLGLLKTQILFTFTTFRSPR
jgi:hypothetical protein